LVAAVEAELVRTGKSIPLSEAALGKARTGVGGASVDLQQNRQRIALLEGENQLLRQRIAAAREQVEQLRTRLRFIEDRGTGDAA